MQRKQIIQMLSRQKQFKLAVIEMLQSENKILEKEIEYHKTLDDSGDTEVPDTDIFDDKKPETVEKP